MKVVGDKLPDNVSRHLPVTKLLMIKHPVKRVPACSEYYAFFLHPLQKLCVCESSVPDELGVNIARVGLGLKVEE